MRRRQDPVEFWTPGTAAFAIFAAMAWFVTVVWMVTTYVSGGG